MAGRIPEFQRQKLASSAVGIVGADTSVARAVSGLGRTVTAIGNQQVQQERQQAQQDLKQSARRSQAESRSRVNLSEVQFRRRLAQLGADSQSQEDYNTGQDELFQEFTAEMSDEDRAAFNTVATDAMIRKGDQFSKVNENRKLNNLKANIDAADDEAALEAAEIFSFPDSEIDVGTKLIMFSDVVADRMEALEDHTDDLTGAGVREAQKGAIAKITTGVLEELMETDPEAVPEFLDVIKDTGAFNTEEMGDIRDQAAKMAEAQKKQAKLFGMRQGFSRAQQWSALPAGKYPSSQDISQAQLNGEVTAGEAKAMRDLKASSNRTFLGDNPTDLVGLTASIQQALTLEKRKGEVGGFFSPGSFFDTKEEEALEKDLEARFYAATALSRQKILESMESGGVSESTGNKLLKSLGSAFTEDIVAIQKDVTTIINQTKLAGNTAFAMFTDEARVTEAQGAIEADYLQRIDVESNKKGRDLTLDEVVAVRARVIDDFTTEINPAKTAFPIGSVHRRNGQVLQVLGYRENGNPYFTTTVNDSKIPKKEE